MRIGIDLMGSDTSPIVLFDAVLQMAEELDQSSSLIVLATHEVVQELVRIPHPTLSSPHTGRIIFHVVTEVITMGDEPLYAVRHKKASSLVTGIRLLKKRHIDAFISTGNTGALITSATLSLSLLPGIRRPALLSLFPTKRGAVAVVDVGGNVSCKAHHLVQFAHMGAAYQRCRLGIEAPVVGLLNIGVESKKGTSELRQVYQTLEAQSKALEVDGKPKYIHFYGNIEGREVFQGKVDVLVTDGFTGNVLLKATEGVSSFIFGFLHEVFETHPNSSIETATSEFERYFNYAEYPGAIVCGVDGVVIKCHGHSSPKALYNGIRGAITLVQKNLIANLKDQLAHIHNA